MGGGGGGGGFAQVFKQDFSHGNKCLQMQFQAELFIFFLAQFSASDTRSSGIRQAKPQNQYFLRKVYRFYYPNSNYYYIIWLEGAHVFSYSISNTPTLNLLAMADVFF